MSSYEKELRMGLVLYGGVSLCMYIFGVVYEFLRFVRKEGSYKELADEAKIKPIIDVISGTSAGGINGIFLAKALSTGASLNSLKSLWINEGDIDSLIDMGGKPASLIDSENYQKKLKKALDDLVPNPDLKSDFELLDLFITTTDLDGVIKTFEGSTFSTPVVTKVYDTVFHFKMRPERYDKTAVLNKNLLNADRTGRNDFAGDDVKKKNKYFAKIAAATSAFPVAFCPVAFSTEEKTDMIKTFHQYVCNGNNDEETVYGDGGLVNNRPFNYTVQTIFNRQADTIVDRKMFFVEPDPETLKIMDDNQTTTRLAKRGNVDGFDSLKGLFEAGLYQSIAADLNSLFEMNKKVLEVKSVVHNLEHSLGKYICGQDENCKNLIRSNPCHKIYMEFKRDKLLQVIEAEIISRIDDKNNEEALKTFVHLKLEEMKNEDIAFLQKFDYPFRIRRIRYFVNKINSWFRSKELDKAIIVELGIFKQKLYDFIEYYNHESWRITEYGVRLRFEGREEQFNRIVEEYGNMMSAGNKQTALAVIQDLENFARSNNIPDDMLSLVDIYDAYEFLDMHVYPIVVLSDTGEADAIEVVRISPDLATHYSKGNLTGAEAISERLAGEKLMHFSAFLKKSWRENDILQGRLDAAEIIVKTVYPEKEHPDADKFIDMLCKGIVEEELKSILLRCKDGLTGLMISQREKDKIKEVLDDKYGLNVEDTEKYFVENYKVGAEELKDVNNKYLLRVAAKTVKTLGLMLQRFPEKSSPQVGRYISRPINVISKINNYIYNTVIAFTGELKDVFTLMTVCLVSFIVLMFAFKVFGIISINDPFLWGAVALLGIWLVIKSKVVKISITVLYVIILILHFFAPGRLHEWVKMLFTNMG